MDKDKRATKEEKLFLITIAIMEAIAVIAAIVGLSCYLR